MYKGILAVLAVLLFTSILPALNHMDIMTTMTGEFDFAEMGWIMTTLDWNGDNYDDLVIMESGWRPPEHVGDPTVKSYGKLNFYLGGPDFDNIPEITLPGSYEREYWATYSMCNAGDMNGDGIDDLALFRATMYEENIDQYYDLQLCVFYGGANPDTVPDYVLTFPREEWDNTFCYVRGLGDINHDGFNDIGYILDKDYYQAPNSFGIIYGGNMMNTVFMEAGSSWDWSSICGVGDVNADGIDDFSLCYTYFVSNTTYRKDIIYFGSISGVFQDSLVICDGSNLRNPFTYPAGDVNGDGYSDFVSAFSGSDAKLIFGGPGFNGTNCVNIAPPYSGDPAGEGFCHGDVNGNGTDDLMGTNVTQFSGYGDAYLWIGGIPMNGGPDLHLTPTLNDNNKMYGFCLTMGDYNGDGCCDAAISAPFDYSGSPYPGKVFVYAGNTQLDDPTPISDNTNIPAISKLQLYPNPLQSWNSELNVRFTVDPGLTPDPSLARKRGEITATFEIYNIRGQKVKSFTMNAEQAKSGSAIYNLNDLSSGVYVCVFTNGEAQQKQKITVIR